MPTALRSIQKSRKKIGKKQTTTMIRKAARPKRVAARVKTPPVSMPPVEILKKTIAYFYLLSFCPPARITEFVSSTKPMRKALADSAALSEAALFKMVTPEVCRRIVSFHQITREPGRQWVDKLLDAAYNAAKSSKKAEAFQQVMSKVSRLPQRADLEGRLHRKKGCQFCQAPCSYGYFTLISDPEFRILLQLFADEARKPALEQNPLDPCLRFTQNHLASLTGMTEEIIEKKHLVNLSYCLLLLGIARSRLAAPEKQLQLLQAAGQEFLRSAQAESLVKPD